MPQRTLVVGVLDLLGHVGRGTEDGDQDQQLLPHGSPLGSGVPAAIRLAIGHGSGASWNRTSDLRVISSLLPPSATQTPPGTIQTLPGSPPTTFGTPSPPVFPPATPSAPVAPPPIPLINGAPNRGRIGE